MARNGTLAIEEPYSRADSITPNDSTVIKTTDAIRVNGAGDVVVTMLNGSDQTFYFPAGGGLNVAVTRIKSTGTTATGIKALYRD